MISFCFAVEKVFNFSKFKDSHEKQIKLFSILIKTFLYFIYNYNDSIIYDYILDKNSDKKKIKFVFYKNELGRLISKNVIRMMYKSLIVKRYNKLSKTENNICSRTINFGSQILEMMFTERDNYFMNYLNRNVFPSYLFKVISIQLNDENYIQINKEAEKLEKLYYSFFIFDLDKKELIKEVNNCLESILNISKNKELNPYLLKSNYCFILCRLFFVIDFSELEEEKLDSEFKNIIKMFISNFFNFLHYFIEKNEFHALILCSYYILKAILKIPINYAVDVFKIYAKCAKLIQEHRGVIENFIYFKSII